MNDIINKPDHYVSGRKYEPLSVIEDWELPYHLGQVIKYLSRYQRKDVQSIDPIVDLKKADYYLNRFIKIIESIE
jgi:hypothetical protein